MKNQLNPPVKAGDVVICYFMDGESSVPPGTQGVVDRVSNDPFDKDAQLIYVNWENGSKLALVSSVDYWKKANQSPLQEQSSDERFNFAAKNEDLIENFDWRFFRDFLYKVRDSGIINMFGAAPLIYAGRNHIERYYGEGREDDDKFQEVLDLADESRNKFIQGVVKYMESKDMELEEGVANHYARKFSQLMLQLYILFAR